MKEMDPTAKVTIYQVTKRSWGELVTDARVDDDYPYVGTQEWRERQRAGHPPERVPSRERRPR